MWTSIFSAIAAVPQLIDTLEKFAQWLISEINLIKQKQQTVKLDNAVTKAESTKDTSGLDAVFDPNKKQS